MDYNPAIKLYRFLTPDMKTEWEKAHTLNLSDVKFASRFFDLSHRKRKLATMGGESMCVVEGIIDMDYSPFLEDIFDPIMFMDSVV